MRELDLKVQCPELLQQIPGFPNDGTGTALHKILDEIDVNQTALRNALGFDVGDTTLEQEISVDLDNTFKTTKDIVLSMLSKEDRDWVIANPDALWDNKLNSGMKISKSIARRAADNSLIVDYSKQLMQYKADKLFEHITRELPKYPFDKNEPLEILKNPTLIVQNFFSEVAAAKNKRIGFTMDMLMMLRGANSPNYSSCYKIDRDYNSMCVTSFCLSGMAGMIYIRDDSSILGRCWVIFAPDFKSFSVLKDYGFISNDMIHTVSSWLCTLLGADKEWLKNTTNNKAVSVTFSTIGLYCDPIKFQYSCNIQDNTVYFTSELPAIPPVCLLCGERVFSNTIMCDKCKRSKMTKCSACGKLMMVDKNHQVQLCTSCLSKKAVCPDCGRVYDIDKGCFCSKQIATCTFCNKEAIVTFNGIALCSDCISVFSKDTCDLCGNHGMMYPFKNKALCQRCFVAVTATEGYQDINSYYPEELQQKINNLLAE